MFTIHVPIPSANCREAVTHTRDLAPAGPKHRTYNTAKRGHVRAIWSALRRFGERVMGPVGSLNPAALAVRSWRVLSDYSLFAHKSLQATTVPAASVSTSVALHKSVSTLGGGLLFAGVLLFSVPGVRRRRHLLAMLLLISIVGCATGCGNVSSKSNRSQTYTFTVTSSATAYGATTTQTSTFTVTN